MVTIGLIGCGYWGANLLRNLTKIKEVNIKWVAELRSERRSELKRLYSRPKFTESYAKIFDDQEINAVVIATPTTTHFEITMQALEAGKHCLVEKPFVKSSESVEKLCAVAEERALVLMVDHLLLYHPAVVEMLRRINDDEIGQIHYAYSQRLNLGIIRDNENVLWSLGSHDIALMLELFHENPVHISGMGEAYIQREKKLEDIIFLDMLFPNGAIGHLQMSWLDPHKTRRFTVVGSKKMIVFDDMEPREKLKIYDKGIVSDQRNISPQLRFGDVIIPNIDPVEPLIRVCQHFIDCIQNGETPRTNGQSAAKVIKVLELAQRSIGGRVC